MKVLIFHIVLLFSVATHAAEAVHWAGPPKFNPAWAKDNAIEAYIYAYPLVTTEITRRVTTNVAKPEGDRAPMGQLIRQRSFPNAKTRAATAPNVDTLSTTAFVDVGKEPWVLSIPDARNRYCVFSIVDAWTAVIEDAGKRTTGTGPQKYAITGPHWKGTLPSDVTECKSPTATAWILGRIYCTGTPQDFAVVHKFQDEISLVPLSSYGKSYTPPAGKIDPNIDMNTPVRDQVNALGTEAYFNFVTKLMTNNPGHVQDASGRNWFQSLGIAPGKKVDSSKLNFAKDVNDVPKLGFEKIMRAFSNKDEGGRNVNGWLLSLGTYRDSTIARAFVTANGLGAIGLGGMGSVAVRARDAVFSTSETDAEGQPYLGTNQYTIHFDEDQLPPVDGFWSLTMHNEQMFLVDNPLNRYSLGARNKFTKNPDGSVDLYLQHDNPGGNKEANWVPTPEGRFIPMLRLYWPKEQKPSILDGGWKPPAIKKEV